jgi:hypothetical protein
METKIIESFNRIAESIKSISDRVRKLEVMKRPTYDTSSIYFSDGWIFADETWTYASANTFTVAGDQTAKYSFGIKIRLTNDTLKYFYVVSSSYIDPSTTVTVAGGSSYVLSNDAITDGYYTRIENPLSFPSVFLYTPVWASFGVQPVIGNGTMSGSFWINGNAIHQFAQISMGSTTTYGTGGYTIAQIITGATVRYTGIATMFDATAGITYTGSASVSGNIFQLSYNTGTVSGSIPFTFAVNDRIILQIVYVIG